jgi:AcrR family transcriptional regulator
VLAAAQEAFATEGLSVPLDEIARRAGVGAGTVYRHFPTKEALFEAVVISRISGLIDYADALSDAADPADSLLDLIKHILTAGAAKRDLVDALAGAGVDVSAATAGETEKLCERMDSLLGRAQAAGRIRGDVTGADLMALVASLLIATTRAGSDTSRPERLLSIFCAGLRTSS